MSVTLDDRLEIGRWNFWKSVSLDFSGRLVEGPKTSSCAPYKTIVSRNAQQWFDGVLSPLAMTVVTERGGI